MDFQQLLAKMVELDQPTTETTAPIVSTEACGDPMGMTPPMADQTPPPAHPSMSVNLNAQGMDNIESLMKLMTKVNPDMINQPQGGMPPMPSLTGPGPSISAIGDLGNLDAGPLKMLPDMDSDNDDMPGGEKNHMEPDGDEGPEIKGLDQDDDGDHDMDDHDMEKKDKEEAFGNSLGDSEPEYMDMDAAIRDGNDLNKPKKSFSGKPYRGDNPMAAGAYESKETLRANIRAELQQRLAEAKGAK
jgi:hypothetical protein